MRRVSRSSSFLTGALSAVVLLSVAGCGGGGQSDASGEGTSPSPSKSKASPTGSPSTAQGPLSEQQARAALLAEGNLPSGWKHADLDDTTVAGDAPDDLSTKNRDCKKLIDALGGDLDKHEARTDGSRDYRKSADGPYLSSEVASYDQAKGAKRALGTFKSVSKSCKKVTTRNNAVTIDWKVSQLKRKTGADSAGVRLRGKAEGGPGNGKQLTLDLVLSRVKQSTTGLALLTTGKGDDKLSADLAKEAAKRLKAVAKGRTPTPTVPPEKGD
ncbi:hypothetical protein [Streptomyces albus]|uniref:Lipoprotein n=1 Tax=Streptomyces albus TaxID=1888 RepID=A0A8H1LFZ7_9ACTN|nr:hypothetical protein [Streptomyces albus]TGG83370.1 hypothetical protein D8771_15185 [Streptomyces albus]UVN56876.1 hypothetical protein NR995_21945 [Streptomyces albus]